MTKEQTQAVLDFAKTLKQRITDDNGNPIATLTVKGIDRILKEYLNDGSRRV